MSWSGSAGKVPLVDSSGTPNRMASLIVSQSQQARNLASGFGAFVSARTRSYVNGVFWHTWDTAYSDTTDVWDWTGLVQRTGSTVTPMTLLAAFKTYAFKVEGVCKRKVLATDCLKR